MSWDPVGTQLGPSWDAVTYCEHTADLRCLKRPPPLLHKKTSKVYKAIIGIVSKARPLCKQRIIANTLLTLAPPKGPPLYLTKKASKVYKATIGIVSNARPLKFPALTLQVPKSTPALLVTKSFTSKPCRGNSEAASFEKSSNKN
jgi:hypothetical protein